MLSTSGPASEDEAEEEDQAARAEEAAAAGSEVEVLEEGEEEEARRDFPQAGPYGWHCACFHPEHAIHAGFQATCPGPARLHWRGRTGPS